MTNREMYELICEKATKYNRLVGVLDKIRAEIADLNDVDCYNYEGYYKAVADALQIIDKYKAESEDKE